MHEILRNLAPGSCVLDLGCGSGTFGPECCPGSSIVRLDIRAPAERSAEPFVQAEAARLPFCDDAFDAVIANHSLEHVGELQQALQEIGRVIRPGGSLYVAVPDAASLTDRLYRWLFRGGGHINPFQSPGELCRQIAAATALTPVATRVLHTSLRYLDRRNFHPRPPRRLWLFGNGNLKFVAALTYALRLIDRLLGTRASVYGWAFYFGHVPEEIDSIPWTNVCVGCGAGHSVASLISNHRIHRACLVLRTYHCPNCGVWNLFTPEVAPAADSATHPTAGT